MKRYTPILEIRMKKTRYLTDQPTAGNVEEVISVMKPLYDGLTVEHFKVILLSSKNNIIGIITVATGTIDKAAIYPREVMKAAILGNATAIILTHNHPGGDPAPSYFDREVTEKIREVAGIFDIKVHDHIIFGEKKAYSMTSDRIVDTLTI